MEGFWESVQKEENNSAMNVEKRESRKLSKTAVAVISGAASSFVLVLILALVAFAHRGEIFEYLAEDYYKKIEDGSQIGGANEGGSTGTFSQESFVISAVKRANPAVVSIIITKELPTYETYFENQNPFGDIFGGSLFPDLFQIPRQRQKGTEKREVGGGSGFFVTGDGMLVTNRHVVDDPKAEYTVLTNDGKRHDAKVLAVDSVLDVAILQIENKDYPFLALGDSDKLEVGQSVIAIGNALAEFRNTVSVGVISGLARSITAGDSSGKSEALEQVIQTDAAINPGNSGGPLLNLRSEVIGVNVAVAQGSENIGFALPINSIKSAVESVKETGKIIRPYLGIRYVEVTESLKEKNNLSVDYGVLVKGGQSSDELAVIPGSPADKAGIVENDIILEIDGRKITEEESLALIIREKKVGDTVRLKILHKGENKNVSVVLEVAPN